MPEIHSVPIDVAIGLSVLAFALGALVCACIMPRPRISALDEESPTRTVVAGFADVLREIDERDAPRVVPFDDETRRRLRQQERELEDRRRVMAAGRGA